MRAYPGMIRALFFWVVVRPLVGVVIGLNVRHRERLPAAGPAIVVANHNSHLDTLVLMTLFPSRLLRHLRPVAAADYFLSSRTRAWFSRQVMGIIAIERVARKAGSVPPSEDPLADVNAALACGAIVILFPEGTRGEPERLAEFKSGVAHLAKRNAAVPVVPVFLHGLGKVLPKGRLLPVPFFCDVLVGAPIFGRDDHKAFLTELRERMTALAAEVQFPPWD